MASVFLSYDRDDEQRASAIAAAIERAGHSVWWDHHIKAGTQYSHEIEQALKDADAVVVLWSVESVQSAWVRDEAAAGRDSGRLIPVMIDKTDPPLGFRQYQSIDLSQWKKRGKSAAFEQLLGSIDALGRAGPAATPGAAPTPVARKSSRRLLIPLIIVALLLAGSFAVWKMAGRGNAVPVIAVAAADGSPVSTKISRDLLVMLGSLQSVRGESMRLAESGPATADADLIFEASANGASEANLVLLSGKDRSILWSKEFKPPSGNPSDLKQQLAYTAARVLDCTLEAVRPKQRPLDPQTLGLYLNGCAQFAELIGTNTIEIIPLFERVTKAAPWFGPGWAKLLLAETLTTDLPGNSQSRVEPALIRQHIVAARAVNPQMVEVALADISLLPSTALLQRSKLIDQSLRTEPQNANLLASRSKLYASVGRLNDAVSDAKRASQLEPLSPAFRHTYISVLSHAGQTEAAYQELENAERLWPGASNMIDARFRLDIFYGNAKEAQALMRKGVTNYQVALQPVLDASIDPSPAHLDRARNFVREMLRLRPRDSTGPVHGYGSFGIADELFALLDPTIHTEPELFSVLFRPAFRAFRKDRRFMPLAARFGLVDYWRTTGVWPDYCRDPDLPYDCKAEAAKAATRTGGA